MRKLLVNELFGPVDVYEGETVQFLFDTNDAYLPSGKKHPRGEEGSFIQGGFHAGSTIKKYDIEGNPERLFNWAKVNQYGIGGWQYTFIDDGIDEGTEYLLNVKTHAWYDYSMLHNKDGKE